MTSKGSSYQFFICFILSASMLAWTLKPTLAWNEKKTHPEMTNKAIELFLDNLPPGLKFNLTNKFSQSPIIVMKDNLSGEFISAFSSSDLTMKELIRFGSIDEDTAASTAIFRQERSPIGRFLRHFFDSTNRQGLNNFVTPSGFKLTPPGMNVPQLSSLEWAKASPSAPDALNDRNAMGLKGLEESYKRALETTEPFIKNLAFANVYYRLGFLMHLVQDLSQPAHVRNDGHPEDESSANNKDINTIGIESLAAKVPINNALKVFSVNSNTAGDLAIGVGPIRIDGQEISKLSIPKIDKTDDLWANTGETGLAQFSNTHFFSKDTIRINRNGAGQSMPYPLPIGNQGGSAIKKIIGFSPFGYNPFVKLTAPIAPAPPIQYTLETFFIESDNIEIKDESNGFQTFRPMRLAIESIYKQTESPTQSFQANYNDFNFLTRSDNIRVLLPQGIRYSAGVLKFFFQGWDVQVGKVQTNNTHIIISSFGNRNAIQIQNKADAKRFLWNDKEKNESSRLEVFLNNGRTFFYSFDVKDGKGPAVFDTLKAHPIRGTPQGPFPPGSKVIRFDIVFQIGAETIRKKFCGNGKPPVFILDDSVFCQRNTVSGTSFLEGSFNFPDTYLDRVERYEQIHIDQINSDGSALADKFLLSTDFKSTSQNEFRVNEVIIPYLIFAEFEPNLRRIFYDVRIACYTEKSTLTERSIFFGDGTINNPAVEEMLTESETDEELNTFFLPRIGDWVYLLTDINASIGYTEFPQTDRGYKVLSKLPPGIFEDDAVSLQIYFACHGNFPAIQKIERLSVHTNYRRAYVNLRTGEKKIIGTRRLKRIRENQVDITAPIDDFGKVLVSGSVKLDPKGGILFQTRPGP